MKKKNTKTQSTSTESKTGHYNLRNRPSDETKNLEKMFSQMKKEIIDEIVSTAENILDEHKNKIISTITESQINESSPIPENDEENKTSKKQKSKKKKNKNSNISKENIEEDEIENENKNIDSLPKKTKSKKSHFSKKKKKKKITKKDNTSLANGGEKPDASSLNDISKVDDTGSKVEKKEKSGNEELPSDNLLIGKKRKRGIIKPFIKSENNKDKKKSK